MNGKSRRFKDLKVYQLAYELAMEIFNGFPKEERLHGITASCYCHCYLNLPLKKQEYQIE